jgi:hypothetical protein
MGTKQPSVHHDGHIQIPPLQEDTHLYSMRPEHKQANPEQEKLPTIATLPKLKAGF